MATWDAQGLEIKTTNRAQWHTPGIPTWGNWRQEDEKFVIKVTSATSEVCCEGEKRSQNKRAGTLVPSGKGRTKAEATSPRKTGVK